MNNFGGPNLNIGTEDIAYDYSLQGLNIFLVEDETALRDRRSWRIERSLDRLESSPWDEAEGVPVIGESQADDGLSPSAIEYNAENFAQKNYLKIETCEGILFAEDDTSRWQVLMWSGDLAIATPIFR
jgi:hypothetical protein